MLPAPEACSPLPKHCIRAHSVRSIWKCIEAASAYVCQRTRTHPVWKLEERPSAFHRELVTVADSLRRFGYCTARCAQLHSVLQSHLLAERITVLEKSKKGGKKQETNKPQHQPPNPSRLIYSCDAPPYQVSASLHSRQRHNPAPIPSHGPKSGTVEGLYCWRQFCLQCCLSCHPGSSAGTPGRRVFTPDFHPDAPSHRQTAGHRCCSACPAHHAEAGKVAGTRQGKTPRQKLNVCTRACKGWHSPFPMSWFEDTSSLWLPLALGSWAAETHPTPTA